MNKYVIAMLLFTNAIPYIKTLIKGWKTEKDEVFKSTVIIMIFNVSLMLFLLGINKYL